MSLHEALLHSKSAMVAETHRINAASSNIASANAESSNVGGAYKAKKIVFANVLDSASGKHVVKAVGVVQSNAQHVVRFDPSHPLSDENGYVYGSNVSMIEEMTDLMSATKSYESNVLVADTVKGLMNKTLQLGKQ